MDHVDKMVPLRQRVSPEKIHPLDYGERGFSSAGGWRHVGTLAAVAQTIRALFYRSRCALMPYRRPVAAGLRVAI